MLQLIRERLGLDRPSQKDAADQQRSAPARDAKPGKSVDSGGVPPVQPAASAGTIVPVADVPTGSAYQAFIDSFTRLVRIPRANVRIQDPDVSQPRTDDPALYDRFADWLPWVVFDKETGLFWIEGKKPGTYEGVGFAMELYPQTGASETMANVLASLTKLGAPPGTGIQISMFGSPRIEPYVECAVQTTVTPEQAKDLAAKKRTGIATPEQAATMHEMVRRMAQHMYQGSTGELHPNFNYRFKDHRVVLSVVWPTNQPGAEKVQTDVLALRDQIASLTSQFYMFDHHWTADHLLVYAAMLLNPHRSYQREWPLRHYDDSRELRHQVLDGDTCTDVDQHKIVFSSKPDHSDAIAMRAMSVKAYPAAYGLNGMSQLLGSAYNDRAQYVGPFVITAGIIYLDYEREKNRIALRAARAQQNAESPLGRYLPILHDTAADWKVLQDAYETGLGSVQMYHQVLVYAPLSKIDDAEQAAKTIWREQGFELSRDRFVQLQGMLAAMPLTLGPLMQKDLKLSQRLSTKTSYNAANLLPVIADWKGTGPRTGATVPTPQFLLGGRCGQVMMIDIFANPSGNNNACVVGKSRSGKSFALNTMVTRTIASGGRAWVFDIGGSYTKLCERLGGQTLSFEPTANLSLNPFSIVTDLEEDIDMLKGVVARMIKPTEPMTDYEMAQLDMHIRSVFIDAELEYGSSNSSRPYPWPTIEELAMSLINNCEHGGPNPLAQDLDWKARVRAMSHEERKAICDPRIADLGRSLMPYTSGGSYGRWFSGPANINFDSNFILLEMDHLSSKPELRAVVLMLLMYLIAQNIYLGRRDGGKLVLIDEAWDLMKTGATSKFIEGLYRKVAKHGGAVVTATQGINDYYGSEAAEAALRNADWMFLLAQKEESIEELSRSGKLVVDDGMKRLLRSVRRVGNQYSEVFIKASDFPPTVGRLFADPYSLLLGTTSAAEVQAIEDLRAQGMSVDEAIQHILKSQEAARRRTA